MKALNQYKNLPKEIYVIAISRLVTSLGSMINVMLTFILNQKFMMSASQIADFMIIYSIILIPALILSGYLADHFNKKNIIVICDSISVIGFLLCGFLPLSSFTLWILVAASVCQTMENSSFDTLITRCCPQQDYEKSFSLVYLANNIGFAICPSLAGFLFNDYLSLMFAIVGISVGISTILIFLFINKKSGDPIKTESTIQEVTEQQSLIKYIFSNKIVIVYIVFVMLYVALVQQSQYLVPLELSRIFGDKGSILFGTISSLSAFIVIIFTAYVTNITQKMIETTKFCIMAIIFFFGFVSGYFFIQFQWCCYVMFILFAFVQIINGICSSPFISRRVSPGYLGRILSTTQLFYNFSAVGFQKVVSILWDNSPTNAWLIVLAGCICLILLTILLQWVDNKQFPQFQTKG